MLKAKFNMRLVRHEFCYTNMEVPCTNTVRAITSLVTVGFFGVRISLMADGI